MTTTWRWMSQRSTTWATDLWWAAAIWLRVGSENRWLRGVVGHQLRSHLLTIGRSQAHWMLLAVMLAGLFMNAAI